MHKLLEAVNITTIESIKLFGSTNPKLSLQHIFIYTIIIRCAMESSTVFPRRNNMMSTCVHVQVICIYSTAIFKSYVWCAQK